MEELSMLIGLPAIQSGLGTGAMLILYWAFRAFKERNSFVLAKEEIDIKRDQIRLQEIKDQEDRLTEKFNAHIARQEKSLEDQRQFYERRLEEQEQHHNKRFEEQKQFYENKLFEQEKHYEKRLEKQDKKIKTLEALMIQYHGKEQFDTEGGSI